MKILPFPEHRQRYEFDCGACALRSVLAYYGINAGEEEVMGKAGTTETGTLPANLANAARQLGLEKIEAGPMTLEQIKNYLDRDIPVILLIQAWGEGHYVVAIGYDERLIYFEDPFCDWRTHLTFQQLEERWHDTDSTGQTHEHWGMVALDNL